MNRRFLSFTPLMALAALVAFVSVPVEAAGRYQMTPIEGGFMRLDTETGAVSICKNTAGKVTCEMAEDSATRYSGEIDDLKKKNDQLQAEVKRLEQHFGLGPEKKGGPNDLEPPVPPGQNLKIPQKEDVDKMFDYIEGMLNKFRERLRRLEKEPKEETPL